VDGDGGVLIGLGHDLQSLHGLKDVQALWEPGVFFTEEEAARFQRSASPLESLAGCFCSKEALFKAMPPLDGWFWTDVEVIEDERHAPRFRFYGALREHIQRQGWEAWLSISHSGDYASAVVVVAPGPRR
jgi:holo-[acyl-carrier protein] synthase